MAADQKISYCLWVNREAEEAADFYTSLFKNSRIKSVTRNPLDTPSGKDGTVLTISFELEGQPFLILNGGAQDLFNPAISFFFRSDSPEEIENLWKQFSEGGEVLMELKQYPHSNLYGWIRDKYGLSWQLMLNNPQQGNRPRLMPSLLFTNQLFGRAEEAIQLYTSVFADSNPGMRENYPAAMGPESEGKIMYADFRLDETWFAIMESNGPHKFEINMALSFMVLCDSQEEVDHYWNSLTANGGKEVQCGWLEDPFGVSWQIVPKVLLQLISGNDKAKAKRVMQAMMEMVKLDVEKLEKAAIDN